MLKPKIKEYYTVEKSIEELATLMQNLAHIAPEPIHIKTKTVSVMRETHP